MAPASPRLISLTPTISPLMFTSGPPELPPKIGASWPIQRTIDPTSSPSSVIRLNGQNMPGMIISVLLTIPIVTDWESASGLPRASTRSPTFSFVDIAEVRHRERARLGRLQLEDGDVRERVGPDELRRNLLSRRERADDRACLSRHVMVRQHVAVGGDDGSAARRLPLDLTAFLILDADDVDADETWRNLGQRDVDSGGL